MSKTKKKQFGDDFKPREKSKKKKVYTERKDYRTKLRKVLTDKDLEEEEEDEIYE